MADAGAAGAAKVQLRRDMRQRRAALPAAQRRQADAATAAAIATLLDEHPDSAFAAFRALPGEAGLEVLLQERWRAGERIWLPRVSGPGRLDWHPISRASECTAGSYGISEPDPAQVLAEDLPVATLLCVPGCAFDAAGRRLGMGAGFYDRLLADVHGGGGISIGIAYACQVVDRVPCEAHDQALHAVCADGRWIKPPPDRR